MEGTDRTDERGREGRSSERTTASGRTCSTRAASQSVVLSVSFAGGQVTHSEYACSTSKSICEEGDSAFAAWGTAREAQTANAPVGTAPL